MDLNEQPNGNLSGLGRASRRLARQAPENAAELDQRREEVAEEMLEDLNVNGTTHKKPSAVSQVTWEEICRRLSDNGPDFDIFNDYGDLVLKDGTAVEYTLKRDGRQIATLKGKSSWDDIQRIYGEGSYRAVIRVGGDGIIRMHQNRTLERSLMAEPAVSPTTEAQGKGSAITLTDVRELLREEREEYNRRLQELQAHQKDKSDPLVVELMRQNSQLQERMQTQQTETMKLVLEAVKGPSAQTQAPALGFEKILEYAKTLVDLTGGAGRKSGGVEVTEHMTAIREAEERGARREREHWEVINELRDEYGARNEGEPKTPMDKILEAAVPIIEQGAKGFAEARRAQGAHGQPQPTEVPRTAHNPRATQAAPEKTGENPMKQKVIAILSPKLQGWILGNKNHEAAADEAHKMFAENGLTGPEVVAAVSIEQILSEVPKDTPQFATDWLKSFYEAYRTKYGN